MSPRSHASQRILNFVFQNDLCQVNDGYNCYGPNKQFRFIAFEIKGVFDGQVKVYGPEFIMVTSQGLIADEGEHVFENIDDCLAYIKAKWIDEDDAAAAAVPRKKRT